MGHRSTRARHGALVLLLLACACDDGNSKETSSGNVVGSDGGSSHDAAAQGDAAGHDAGTFTPMLGDDPVMVTTAGGELKGDVVGDAVRFLKIPYAKPPVDALRWKAPQDAEPWDGVRHEKEFASPCPQPPSQQSAMSTDEDCLYLNVWRPNESKPGAPVMVWIHGGGFTTGSAADIVPTSKDHLWYDGKAFAEHGVVVVTINYRLGVMGFFPHKQLPDEDSPLGNQGLLDQRKALQWVHDNIVAFGGDPENVTIFGQSAGSGSVCMHVASPGSRGLFARAISESGGCTGETLVTDSSTIDDQIAKFASDHGCDGEDTLECLRKLPASELVSKDMVDRTMGMDALRASFSFRPNVDGEGGFLPEPATELFDRGDIAKVPYMLGSTNDEAQLYYIAAQVPETEDDYVAYVKDKYGDFADRVLDMYPSSKFDGDYKKAVVRIATDSGIVCSTLDTARRAQAAGLDVFMYNFNVPWSVSPDLLGTCHVSEISMVFDAPYNESDDNLPVAHAMNAYWASFAKTGDPNYADAPAKWPPFMQDGKSDDARLQFDPAAKYEVVHAFRNEECALWADYAKQ
jgi:para-nitrobenzyl esterase